MTIELDERTLNQLAQKVATIIVRKLRNDGTTDQRLISCNEAAKRLGITPGRLRKIKGQFSFVKRGTDKQAKLFFDADRLISEYQNYQSKSVKF